MVYLTLLAYGCYKNRLKEAKSVKNNETGLKSSRWDEKPDINSLSAVGNNLGSTFKPVVVYSDSDEDQQTNTPTKKGNKRNLEDKSYPEAKQKSARFTIIQNFIPTPVLRNIPLVETLPESKQLDDQLTLSQKKDEVMVDQNNKIVSLNISTSASKPSGMKMNLPPSTEITPISKHPLNPNPGDISRPLVSKNVEVNATKSEVETPKTKNEPEDIPFPSSKNLSDEPSQTKTTERCLEQIEVPSNLLSTNKDELTKIAEPANDNTNEVKILQHCQENINESNQDKIPETNELQTSSEVTPQVISEKSNLNSAYNLPTFQLSYKSNPYALYEPLSAPLPKNMSFNPSNVLLNDHEKQITPSKEPEEVTECPDNYLGKASCNAPYKTNCKQLLNKAKSPENNIENENSPKNNQEHKEIDEQDTYKDTIDDVDATDKDKQTSPKILQIQKPNPIKINLLGGVGKLGGGVMFGKPLSMTMSSSNAAHKDYPEMDQIENFVALENKDTDIHENNKELCDDQDEVVEVEEKNREQLELKEDTNILELVEGDCLSQRNEVKDVDRNKEFLPGWNPTPNMLHHLNNTFHQGTPSFGHFTGNGRAATFPRPPHRGGGPRPHRGPRAPRWRGGRGTRPQRARGRGWGY